MFIGWEGGMVHNCDLVIPEFSEKTLQRLRAIWVTYGVIDVQGYSKFH